MQGLWEISGEVAISAVLIGLLILGNRLWRQENDKYLNGEQAREQSAKRIKRIKLFVYILAPLSTVPLSFAFWWYVIPQIPLLSASLGGASGAIFAIWVLKSLGFNEMKWEKLFPPRRSPFALVKLGALGFLGCSAIILLYPIATDPAARQKIIDHFSEHKGGKG
jgi:hypothetical protein